jgi:hypothetical protein
MLAYFYISEIDYVLFYVIPEHLDKINSVFSKITVKTIANIELNYLKKFFIMIHSLYRRGFIMTIPLGLYCIIFASNPPAPTHPS